VNGRFELMLGVVQSLIASAVFWITLLYVARPRLSMSDHVSISEVENGFVLRVKVANRSLWTAQEISSSAILSIVGGQGRLFFPVSITQSTQPVLGGRAFKSRRRKLYGWVGASHRVFRMESRLNLYGEFLSIAQESENDGEWELIFSVTAVDGMLFGGNRTFVKCYRSSCMIRGIFERGRSMRIV